MRQRGLATDLIALAVSLLICFAAAGLGSAWTLESIPTWYAGIRKPSWNPPNSIFGPVWTALYFLMAVSASIIWRREGWSRTGMVALGLFSIQLALNVAWSGLFFGLHRPDLAFVDIVLLWLAIAATIARFAPISRPAAALLVPYLAWVSFAGVLNLTIWRLNS
ncbi:TspO/MBR family protein [Isosphaeraceae bacterium EP7]